jgi:hypothetical protein
MVNPSMRNTISMACDSEELAGSPSEDLLETSVYKAAIFLTEIQQSGPDRCVFLDYHKVVISHQEGPIGVRYGSRSEQIVSAIQRGQNLRADSDTERLSRETSGLYLFLVQLCICLHLFAFAIY